MKAEYSFALAVSTAILVQFPVLADGNPPVDSTPAALPSASVLTGFPWGLLAVFIAAGFIMSYIKRNNPNKVTNCTCLPLIDEEQQAREKEQIAREKAEKNIS